MRYLLLAALLVGCSDDLNLGTVQQSVVDCSTGAIVIDHSPFDEDIVWPVIPYDDMDPAASSSYYIVTHYQMGSTTLEADGDTYADLLDGQIVRLRTEETSTFPRTRADYVCEGAF